MTLPNKSMFRPAEVADFFGYSRQTIYNWVEKGKVKPKRNKINGHIFIPKEEINEILRLSTVINAKI